MHAPLVLAAAQGGGAVDEDLAPAGRNQAARAEYPGAQRAQAGADLRTAHQRAKQLQRLDFGSRRHPFSQGFGDVRGVRRVQR